MVVFCALWNQLVLIDMSQVKCLFGPPPLIIMYALISLCILHSATLLQYSYILQVLYANIRGKIIFNLLPQMTQPSPVIICDLSLVAHTNMIFNIFAYKPVNLCTLYVALGKPLLQISINWP